MDATFRGRSENGLITVKRSRLIGFLCLFFSFCLLLGCARETALPDFTPLLSEGESEALSEERGGEAFAKRIRLIFPADGSDVLYQKAEELGNAIQAKVDLAWSMVFDRDAGSVSPHVFDVIIGWSEHPDRMLWAEDLRRDDYICASGAHSALIGGLTEETTLLAMEHFMDHLLPYASPRGLMEQGVSVLARGEYPLREVTWNGISLSRWCIVYAEAEEEIVRPIALTLRHTITERSGYVPQVMSDRQYDGEAEAIVLSLSDPSEQRSGICPVEEGICLFADTGYGLSVAADHFVQMLFEDGDGDGICHHSLTVDQILFSDQRFVRLGTVAAPSLVKNGSLTAISGAFREILSRGPSSVCVVPTEEDSLKYFLQNMVTYQWTEHQSGNGTVALGVSDGAVAEIRGGELPVGVEFVRRIGGEQSGFLWLFVREGTALPSWIYEEGLPILVTVYGTESGELSAEDRERMDMLSIQTVSVGDGTLYCRCYGTPESFEIKPCFYLEDVGYWEIEARRKS